MLIPNEPASIFLLSLDSSEVRRLTSPRGSVGDYNPAFSPDGRTLAFNRGSQGVRQSTRCRFREERNNVLSQVFNSDGVWRGRPTVATSFSQRLVGSRMLVGFGRYPLVGVSQNDCSSVKKESNLRFKGTDWSMCARRRISTSGEGSSIHWFRPVLPIGSYLPRGWKVVLSSRLMEVRLPSNLPAAALMKSGCAGATELASSSSPDFNSS